MDGFPAGSVDFEAYVRASGARLLRLGHALTLDRAAAEDLVQETLIRVGLAWPRIRQDGNPVGYAQRTMVNLFLNRRRRKSDIPVEQVPDAGREDDALAAVDSAAVVRQVLAGLPPKQRAAVVLRYVADLPDEEIGRLLDCTPQTVRSQVSRGLAALRRQLAAER
ncbi:SigE family RNA polymerase sigma factor [Cryptosporangium aurantiacum]|uniref:RNA polymerase sigma-70 factor, sigma-E family n=1 Tax=Cryptosporangium aurantiacum TaxID=134849 RepID=A0A1M7QU11_9ACTN|nr:SigE family RNA polymerase sigma factor [Cryptosporangium aurantiacum]SHN35092.1 RNA polymerase sigma-70 factor, sigma-E family [Cryptosporangium aurantiacum]